MSAQQMGPRSCRMMLVRGPKTWRNASEVLPPPHHCSQCDCGSLFLYVAMATPTNVPAAFPLSITATCLLCFPLSCLLSPALLPTHHNLLPASCSACVLRIVVSQVLIHQAASSGSSTGAAWWSTTLAKSQTTVLTPACCLVVLLL